MRNGFTLIELLVVVLIIGILASVAVPQYQKAVERSRATEAITLLKTFTQALEAHHLANGAYAASLDELAVDMPSWTGNTRFLTGTHDASNAKSNGKWSLQIEQSTETSTVSMYISRISGKYKGTGFKITLENANGPSKWNIFCFERISGANYLFDTSLTEGAYCNKIMQAPLSQQTTWSRLYKMP